LRAVLHDFNWAVDVLALENEILDEQDIHMRCNRELSVGKHLAVGNSLDSQLSLCPFCFCPLTPGRGVHFFAEPMQISRDQDVWSVTFIDDGHLSNSYWAGVRKSITDLAENLDAKLDFRRRWGEQYCSLFEKEPTTDAMYVWQFFQS
jgi:Zn-finger protein